MSTWHTRVDVAALSRKQAARLIRLARGDVDVAILMSGGHRIQAYGCERGTMLKERQD